MHDTSAGAHAVGGDDHHRAFRIVKRLRIFGRLGVRELGIVQRLHALSKDLFRTFVVDIRVARVECGDRRCHRAVEDHAKILELAGAQEFADVEDQVLRAADGECRNDDFAAGRLGVAENRQQLVARFVERPMIMVAIGRFQAAPHRPALASSDRAGSARRAVRCRRRRRS